MASLLDLIVGDTPEKQAQMSLLYQGAANRNLVGGLLAGNQYAQQAPEREMARQYKQAQLAEILAQGEERRAKIKQSQDLSDLVGGIFGAGGLSAPQVAPGAFSPSPVDGMGPTMPQSMSGQAQPGSRMANLGFDQLAILKRAGLDLTELHKYANDPLKMEGGSTYVNRVTGKREYMPKVGEGIGPDGQGGYTDLPNYAAGAARIEGAKTRAQEEEKARLDPLNLGYVDSGTGRPIGGSRLDYLKRGPQPQQPQPQPGQVRNTGPGTLTPELQAAILADSRAQGFDTPPTANFTAPGVKNPVFGFQSTAPTGKLQSEAEKTQALKTAEADVGRVSARAKDVKTAEQFLSVAKQAEMVLGQGPTGSGFGSAVDSAAGFFGKATDGAVAAQQLKALGGWLVSNVPRMEGPQSNFDVGNYQTMAADVGNDKLPVERRVAALKTIQTMMNNVISGQPADPAEPTAPKAAPLPPKPSALTLSKGQAYNLPNGKVGVWDGFKFQVKP
jgi:hypothetical protein